MKKPFVFIFIVILSISLLPAGTISWKWRGNDNEVMYFRYRMDNSDWNTVESESYEVRYNTDTSIPHSFEIQQSYDGENWSESSYKEYKPFVEKLVVQKERAYSKATIRLNFIPQENVTVRNSNTGVDDYYAEYSFGFEANGTYYFNKLFGIGLSGSFNRGIKKIGEDDSFYNFGVFFVPSLRIVSNNKVEVAIKGGVGMEIEPYNGIAYIAPSYLAQIDASVFLSDNLSLAISPSFVYSKGDFLVGSKYESTTIKILSIGAAWNF